MNERKLLEKDLLSILKEGQNNTPSSKFKKVSWWSYGKVGLIIFGSALILLFIISLAKNSFKFDNNVGDKALELLPVWIFATSAFLITLFITQRNHKRNIAFKLLEELNSVEFLKVRYDLGNQIKKALDSKSDVDRFNGWFPHVSLIDPNRSVENWEKLDVDDDFEGFLKNHSMAKMVYFILRIANYSKHGMIDMKLTKHLFHFFFAHYETLMLEFAKGLRIKRHKFNSEFGFNFDDRWDLCAERIEYFFKSIGLSGSLPVNYEFIYFPSLNQDVNITSESLDQNSTSINSD